FRACGVAGNNQEECVTGGSALAVLGQRVTGGLLHAWMSHRAGRDWPPRGRAGSANRGRRMKRQLTGPLRRSVMLVAGPAAAAVLVVGSASPAGAYGGGRAMTCGRRGFWATATTPRSAARAGLAAFSGWAGLAASAAG